MYSQSTVIAGGLAHIPVVIGIFWGSVFCGKFEALLLKNFWIKEKTPITTGIWAKPPAITVDCEYIF